MSLTSSSPPVIPPLPFAAKLAAIRMGAPLPLPQNPCTNIAYWPVSKDSCPPAAPQLDETPEVTLKTSEPDLVGSKADVAVIWTDEIGTAGGTYVAVAGPAGATLPQAEGAQDVPPTLSVQVTLGVLLGSFWISALKVMPLPPANTEVTSDTVTDTGGRAVIVNASKSDFVPSVFDTAVSVAVWGVGTELGGV